MVLPEAFIRSTRQLMGDRLYSLFDEGLKAPPPTSIRLHPLKADGFAVSPEWHPEAVGWCRGGYYLSGRPPFTFDPLLHAGAYYVQDAASMFVDQVLRQHVHEPSVVLDLCAAPGGKSTAALSALPSGSVLFANEPMGLRAQILAENLLKYGHADVVVTNNYPADYERSGLTFDLILADVPCSGEGMFRKDEGAIAEWSEPHVEKCWRLQREIVTSAWSCLREGGLLVYSTCTLNAKENEANILWAMEELGATLLPVDIQAEWHITGALGTGTPLPVYRFIPGISHGEGQFMAVLQKGTSSAPHSPAERGKKRKKDVAKKPSLKRPPADVAQWLQAAESYRLVERDDHLWAIPQRWHDLYERAAGLKVIQAGIDLAMVKGRDFIPTPALALSAQLRGDAFPTVEVDYATAIDYLSKMAIALPEGTAKGPVLLTYCGKPVGFVKHLGTRSNNLYPQEWKIRSQHRPLSTSPIITKQ